MCSNVHSTGFIRPALVRAIGVLLLITCPLRGLLAQQGTAPSAAAFNAEIVRAAVDEIATLISREYLDPAVAERLAESLRRRLASGEYANVAAPNELAARLTRDLLADSHDKHLVVEVVPAAAGGGRGPGAAGGARQDGVRRTNGGVQRVEILAGNVGYLNLTTFWRIDEARDAIADAMHLLQRADALIIDMRQNGGGSPDTVAFLVAYMLDQGGVPLFDIIPRSGDRTVHATPTPAVAERNGRRPLYVLTSARTFSGGEGFAFLLQERRRAMVIGERTAGAANPGQPYPVGSLFRVTIPNGQVRSAIGGGNWEGLGITPDVAVAAADALRFAHANALDTLIRSAQGDWRRRLEEARDVLNVRP